MNQQMVAGILGLAMRARQVLPGAGRALEHVRQRRTGILLLDMAVSDNTAKRFMDACQHHQVTLYQLPEGLLGRALGMPGTMVALVLPGGLAQQLDKACQTEDNKVAG